MNTIRIVYGDLLQQPVDGIVNAWTRNLVPWWLVRPHGLASAIRERGGITIFRELARYGPLVPGQAVLTGAGRLAFRGIIHVAAISLVGRSYPAVISLAVQNALAIVRTQGWRSVALPILGSANGGVPMEVALNAMQRAIQTEPYVGTLIIVRAPA